MTSPVDLPDFFRGDQWSTPTALVYELNVNHDQNVVNFGPFNVVGWESLVFEVLSTDRLDVTFWWWSDAAGTQFIGKYNYQSSGGAPIYDMVPIIGPYVSITATYHAGAGTVVTTTTVFPRRGATAGHRPTDYWSLSRGSGSNVPAAGSLFTQLLWCTSGRAVLAVTTTATSWYALVYELDKTGATTGLAGALVHDAGDAQAGQVEFLLPGFLCGLLLVNRDAAIRSFTWGITLDRFS